MFSPPRSAPEPILSNSRPILGGLGPPNWSSNALERPSKAFEGLGMRNLGLRSYQACHFSIRECFWTTFGRSWGVILEPKFTKNAKNSLSEKFFFGKRFRRRFLTILCDFDRFRVPLNL